MTSLFNNHELALAEAQNDRPSIAACREPLPSSRQGSEQAKPGAFRNIETAGPSWAWPGKEILPQLFLSGR